MNRTTFVTAVAAASLLLSPAGTAQNEAQPALPILPMPARAAGSPQDKTSQEELIKLRDEKLARPVFKKADRSFDYDAVRARAKQEGKLIFTYFSRSYAH